jgi:hypothetical protein
MRRTRHVIAVVVVATALCADRAVAAAPRATSESPGLARSLATKLTSSLRRSVAPVRMVATRSYETIRVPSLPIRDAESGMRIELSPVQFRLPPPAL